ncbi:MAG: DNA repair protein RecO [Parachlamydiaceae bacterium]
MIYSTEGIVLKVIPYKEYDQMISIFTPESGLIKVFHRGSRAQRKSGKGACIPLTKVEVAYREGRGDLFSSYGVSVLESFSSLRKNYTFLEVGCDLLCAILDSQLIGRRAPTLYALLFAYLQRIPQTENPWILAASFRLKLLKHDGLMRFPWVCCECGNMLQKEAFICGGESRCEDHRLLGSQYFDSIELYAVYRLAESRSYHDICLVDLSAELRHKIASFFKSLFF